MKVTIPVYDIQGKKISTVSVPKEIFGAKINPSLMAQAVRVYLSNQRKAPAKTKTRGEISYSTRKLYRQKGTGRARHGDRKAPIFVKGGIAHGPTGEQNYHLKIPKKMKRLALFSALTSRLKEKSIVVVEGLEKIKPKTKEMVKILDVFLTKVFDTQGFKNKKKRNKLSLILPEKMTNVVLAARNIPEVMIKQAKDLNTYDVLNGGYLIFLKKSLAVLQKNFLKKDGEENEVKPDNKKTSNK